MDPLQGRQLQEDSQGNNTTSNTLANKLIPIMVSQDSSNMDSEHQLLISQMFSDLICDSRGGNTYQPPR